MKKTKKMMRIRLRTGKKKPQHSYNKETQIPVLRKSICTGETTAGFKNTETIDLSKADTSNVTNMSNMFTFTLKLLNLDVSNFDELYVFEI